MIYVLLFIIRSIRQIVISTPYEVPSHKEEETGSKVHTAITAERLLCKSPYMWPIFGRIGLYHWLLTIWNHLHQFWLNDRRHNQTDNLQTEKWLKIRDTRIYVNCVQNCKEQVWNQNTYMLILILLYSNDNLIKTYVHRICAFTFCKSLPNVNVWLAQ